MNRYSLTPQDKTLLLTSPNFTKCTVTQDISVDVRTECYPHHTETAEDTCKISFMSLGKVRPAIHRSSQNVTTARQLYVEIFCI